MENQAYYRSYSKFDCNRAINDRYLVVNCTGCCVLSEPFTNHHVNGRRDYYLIYLCKGSIKIFEGNKIMTMMPGQVVVFYPYTEYKYTIPGNEEIVYYWTHFTGNGAGELMRSCKLRNREIVTVGVMEKVIQEYNNMFTEFLKHDDCTEAARASHLLCICTCLSRSRVGIKREKSGESVTNRIVASLKYIHKNYNKELSLDKLAEIEHLSVSRYRNLFKKQTGMSPHNYIITLRMKRACELIIQTDMTIKEVSRAVGYYDQFYFSRIFKARVGVVPVKYREEIDKCKQVSCCTVL